MTKLRVMKPRKGYLLTLVTESENPIFSDCIYLADNDDPKNWKEISEKTAHSIMAEIEKKALEANNR